MIRTCDKKKSPLFLGFTREG